MVSNCKVVGYLNIHGKMNGGRTGSMGPKIISICAII